MVVETKVFECVWRDAFVLFALRAQQTASISVWNFLNLIINIFIIIILVEVIEKKQVAYVDDELAIAWFCIDDTGRSFMGMYESVFTERIRRGQQVSGGSSGWN